jgi:homoaconitate hydratase family protein/3-isopropylmalate dehydratase small subunit
MGMTMIEKILSGHSDTAVIRPGDIIDVEIDVRVARDFGGANVVKHMREHGLVVKDPEKTYFTFDCNPTGSDQKFAANQHICRLFAREWGIRVYDINRGVGTHLMIEEGLVFPGATAVSTDSHANILGAIGAFGQGMGDKDIAAAWGKGKVWFRVPESVKLILAGTASEDISAKDMVLNLLARFGASKYLGRSIELYGNVIDEMTLDQRITIASMATEMGALTILFPPNQEVVRYCESRVRRKIIPVLADDDAHYAEQVELDISSFKSMVSMPGKPHDAVPLDKVAGRRIDSAFIGSCTNGRIEDMRAAAGILKENKVAEGVILKIVPCTDHVWNQCLEEGLIEIFKEACALVSNPGCAGCAAGQVGQNGPGEVTVSSGNRNFPGKQGLGDVYLASPEIVAATAVAGFITAPGLLTEGHAEKTRTVAKPSITSRKKLSSPPEMPEEFKGKAWYIRQDDIDTDMIYHNSHLAVTDIGEMGQYAFGNLKGYKSFAEKAGKGDIIVTGKNFGAGSSRQQAVDCFKSIGISCIIAGSFGAIYERNAINAAFPVLSSNEIPELELREGDELHVDLRTGRINNSRNNKEIKAIPFSEVQMEIYRNGGLF